MQTEPKDLSYKIRRSMKKVYSIKITTFVLAIALGCAACQKIEENQNPPNIVLFFCDDLGYGDLGITGHPTIQTPHIDGLAFGGMRMTQFYSASPACTASRYALLTGKYPVYSGFSWVLYPQSVRGIHPKEKTIAEVLKEEGYHTACFGKWHLGSTQPHYLPTANGFDEYMGLPYSNDMIPPIHPPIALLNNTDTLELDPDQSNLTRRYTEGAIDFIQRNSEDPFFLYLPYAMPHLPLHPGEAFEGQSLRGKYGDVVEEIDWSVGAVYEALETLQLLENTLLVFTSDNGPWIIKNQEGGSSGLFRDGKGSTWEGGMRVPAIFHWKGKIHAGGLSPKIASTIDLFKTLKVLTNAKEEGESHGIDLSSILLNNQPTNTERSFFFYGPGNILHGVRKGPWKLHIRTSSQTGKAYFNKKIPLLFNLEEDPSEQYDLSDTEPEKVQELMDILDKHIEEVKANPNYWEQERAEQLQKHLAFGKKIEVRPESSNKYGAVEVLTDGLPAEIDQLYQFYASQEPQSEILLDLEQATEVRRVAMRFLQKHRAWIFYPESVEIQYSLDGKMYKKLGRQTITPPKEQEQDDTILVEIEQAATAMRYLKIKVQSIGNCPDWHTGAGKAGWFFADEIYVE